MKLFIFCAAFVLPLSLTGLSAKAQPPVAKFDLVITEIMADPEPSFGLPEAEFIEIFNRSDNPINLGGWILFDGSNKTLPSKELLPNHHIIICANSDTSEFMQYGNVAGISSLSLTNGGEKIALRTASSLSVDSVIFSDSWYGSSYKKDGGWTLERTDPDFTCFESGNWKPSINSEGGTPGSTNSIDGVYSDKNPPLLLRSYCPDSISVILIFSEALDEILATNVQNYNGRNINISSAIIANEDNTKIKLTLSTVIETKFIYTITAANITDCAGNKLNESTVKFGIADTVGKPSITINEILFNPYENGYDFIEVYNHGNSIFNISSLFLTSRNLISGELEDAVFIYTEPWLIFPEEYLVISEKPEAVSSFYNSRFPYDFIEVDDLPSMNIDAGQIALLYKGEIVDEVYYNESFHFSLIEDPKGISLEKIYPLKNSMDADSWHSASTSSGFATPGFRNSQYMERTESEKRIYIQPEIFSPDQDGLDDAVTFNIVTGEPGYISKIQIYNSSGYMIFENEGNNLMGTKDSFTWDGISKDGEIANPGIYIALIELLNLNGEVKYFKLPLVLAIKL